MRTPLRTTLVVALLVVAGQVSVLVTGAWTWAWLTVPVMGLIAYLDLWIGIGCLATVTLISLAGGAAAPPDSWGLAVAVLLSAVAAVAVGRLARLAEIRESD